ncbi:excinuclease ABC subunit UvrA [Sandaracinus amylolyticus]|uniref:UvrABC system protein A n=1 Tax=Sandaracinus amylolyticus TaxID=927083 RepID=A0A0F6W1Q2_9BACT|nr:excinuclease ABC subunit UvrA [Sandaracinus amylolyticus]AKF05015.1 Excinuclease ABC subunit A [Sandaracinus amylolyticus]
MPPRRASRPSTSTPNHSKRSAAAREPDTIEITGAREHNLQVDHLSIPKNALVVFTGPSGSGKSSLAFDTLYAEGQRRYVESLSAYARQFLGRLERPAVERLKGLSPTIAIEQKSATNNPRSTVGTITEIQDYLRVLWARAGRQHCVECGKEVRGRSTDEIVRDVLGMREGAKFLVLAPLVTHRKGEFRDLFEGLASRGFARVRVNGEIHRLDAPPTLDKKRKHDIELVVDRLVADAASRSRIAEAVELGLKEGQGELTIEPEGSDKLTFSASRSCCGRTYPELSPQSFSFNSPLGFCSACNGLGTRTEIDADLVVPDRTKSIREGAIAPWATSVERGEGWTFRIIEAMSEATGVDLDVPFGKLPKKLQETVLYGIEGKKIRVTWGQEGSESHGSWGIKFHGVIPTLMRRYRDTTSERMREHYRQYMRDVACDACDGKRLRPESLSVKVGGRGLAEITNSTVRDCARWFEEGITLSSHDARIAEGVLREIRSRLGFLLDVGLEYLTLDRAGPSLSGGEAQRIRLASQLGSELSGVMYVLDEPSIGLHPRDNERLIATLRHLRDLGNSVIVVEHDEDTIRTADHVIDFGPGAGHLGGRVVFEGAPSELATAKGSITADYITGRKKIEVPAKRRKHEHAITVRGAREHNLKNVDVSFPLGCLVAVTGPSGAGKSSLVDGILLPALARALHNATEPVGVHDRIEGLQHVDKVIAIDQRPIGRTPRSNPGTYTKAFDEIRNIFAQQPDSRARGWEAARYSFNVKGGRCESCQGDGVVRVEMHFLSDVYVPCEVCGGRRYDSETLSVKYKGKSIADVLDTSIAECLELFSPYPSLARVLRTLTEVGLGYAKIGQPAPTLSGGEAQRVKLAKELARTQTGRTLYLLDEPTTGLHFEDVRHLLEVLAKLVEAGNTVVVIEHHLDVIKCADWVIDLGPEGGDAGGRVIATGTPEQIAKNKASVTGKWLAPLLK